MSSKCIVSCHTYCMVHYDWLGLLWLGPIYISEYFEVLWGVLWGLLWGMLWIKSCIMWNQMKFKYILSPYHFSSVVNLNRWMNIMRCTVRYIRKIMSCMQIIMRYIINFMWTWGHSSFCNRMCSCFTHHHLRFSWSISTLAWRSWMRTGSEVTPWRTCPITGSLSLLGKPMSQCNRSDCNFSPTLTHS